MCFGVTYMYIVHKESRRGCWMPWHWSCMWWWTIMWVLTHQPVSSSRAASGLNSWAFSLTQFAYLLKCRFCTWEKLKCLSTWKFPYPLIYWWEPRLTVSQLLQQYSERMGMRLPIAMLTKTPPSMAVLRSGIPGSYNSYIFKLFQTLYTDFFTVAELLCIPAYSIPPLPTASSPALVFSWG